MPFANRPIGCRQLPMSVDDLDLPNQKCGCPFPVANCCVSLGYFMVPFPARCFEKSLTPTLPLSCTRILWRKCGYDWHRICSGAFPGPQEEYSSLLPSAGVTTGEGGDFLLYFPALGNSVCCFVVDCGIVW